MFLKIIMENKHWGKGVGSSFKLVKLQPGVIGLLLGEVNNHIIPQRQNQAKVSSLGLTPLRPIKAGKVNSNWSTKVEKPKVKLSGQTCLLYLRAM